MATLVHLAGSGAVGIVAAPFMLIVLLRATCALWRDWASTRTCVAHQAAARRRLDAPRDLDASGSVHDGGRPFAS